jgi:hypothetical protein
LGHARWEAEKLLSLFQPVQKSQVENVGPMIIGWASEMDDKTNTDNIYHVPETEALNSEPKEVH